IARVQSDNLSFINLHAGTEKQAAAILQVVESISEGFTLDHADQHTVLSADNFAGFDRAIMIEDAGHNAGAGSEGEEQAAKPDQAARGNQVFQPYSSLAIRLHIAQVALTQTQLFHHRAL